MAMQPERQHCGLFREDPEASKARWTLLFGLWFGLTFLAAAYPGWLAAAEPAGQSLENGPSLLDRYQVDAWDTSDGLPQNTVTAIKQTPDGYLWLGTPAGLARFDGIRFQALDSFSSPVFPGEQVNALLPTPEGDLWVGCQGAGAVRLHRGAFVKCSGTNDASHRSVYCLERSADGRIWLGTDAGLRVWQSGRIRDADLKAMPPESHVTGLLATGTNGVWALAANRVFVVNGQFVAETSARATNQSHRWTGLAPSSAQNGWVFGSELLRMPRSDGEPMAARDVGLEAGDRINALCERGNGEVWVGTQYGQLKQLAAGVTSYDLPDKACGRPVRCLFEDSERNLWVGTEGGGLLRVKLRKVSVFGTREGLPRGPITSLCPDGRSEFWVGCHAGGIFHWRSGAFTPFNANGALPTNVIVWSLLQTRDRSLYIGTEGGGLLRWAEEQLVCFGPDQGMRESAVLALCEGSDGSLWFGGRDGGLYHLSSLGIQRFGAGEGFPAHNLTALAADAQGGLWIGSNGEGLYRLFNGRFSHFTQADGLGSENVRVLHLDGEGALWIGTSGGVTRFKDGRFVHFSSQQGLWDNVISQILENDPRPTGTMPEMWFGSNRGIFRIPRPNFDYLIQRQIGSLQPVVYGRSEGMECLECTGGFSPAGMIEYPTPNRGTINSRLWFSTLSGLARLDTVPVEGLGRGIDGDHIAFGKAMLHLGPSGVIFNLGDVVAGGNGFDTGGAYGIWASNGVVELKTRTGKSLEAGLTPEARYHRTALPFVDGVFIPNGGVAADHRVVISSTGLRVELPETTGEAWGPVRSGLRLLEEENFDPLDEERLGPKFIGMPGNQGITFDLEAVRRETGLSVERFTAVACNQHIGLASFHVFVDGQLVARRTGVVRDYDQPERGLFPLDIPLSASTRFLTLISTDDKEDFGLINLRPPPVVIEEVLADGQLQAALNDLVVSSTANAVYDSLHPASPALRIPPGSGRLDFRFAALSLSAPEKVRCRYQLEPLDKGWLEAGERRTARYANVPPGEYRFRVVACNEDGVWNEAGAAIGLVLEPQFWQTRWFGPLWVGTLVAAAVGATVLAVRRRQKRRIARLEHLHAVEAERMRIARDIHDDMGSSMTEISLLSELAKTDLDQPEQAKSHIEQIFTTAHRVARSVDEIVWAISPRNDGLEGSLAYICKAAQDYLHSAGITCELEIPESLPSRVLSSAIRHNLYLAVREALSNVVKHAAASGVRLRMGVEKDWLMVVIADDGVGCDASVWMAAPTGTPAPRAHEGLRSMAQRMETIGGRFELESAPGRGTSVRLVVPCKPEDK